MAHMNGFAKHGLDDDAFDAKSTLAGLKTFDAFRKSCRYLPNPVCAFVIEVEDLVNPLALQSLS
jgi:hypothetical protein